MKRIVILFLIIFSISFANNEGGFVESDLKKSIGKEDKIALVMVHFGTTYDDTRSKTIDAINQDAIKKFGDLKFSEAYTSRIIIRRLKNRNIIKNNPTEVFDNLIKEGYTHLVIQSTNVIPGIEFKILEKQAEIYKDKFKEIRIGDSLLGKNENYKKVLKILKEDIGKIEKDEAVVLVGHGTSDSGNSVYASLDYVAKDMELPFYVGTVESYPGIDTVIKNLKKDKIKKIILSPFMFVAGDHAKNDIAIEWKQKLEENGFVVNIRLKGLGEISGIRNIFLDNAKYMFSHRKEDMISKKLFYSKQKD